jgi:tryptophan synthase alpha chain
MPICVGFGISTTEDVAAVGGIADGVVIGSAFERIIEENIDHPELPNLLSKQVSTLKAATRRKQLAYMKGHHRSFQPVVDDF